MPYHITNYPIFGVAFGLNFWRARYSHGLQTTCCNSGLCKLGSEPNLYIDFLPNASGLRAVYCHLYTRQSMRCVSRNICSLFGYGNITGYTPWLRFSVRNGDKVPDSQHFETNLEGLVQNVDVVGVLTTVTANGSELAPFTANFTSTERGVK